MRCENGVERRVRLDGVFGFNACVALVLLGFLVAFLCSGRAVSYRRTGYGDAAVSRVVKVYDGDTFTVDIDGFPPIVGKGISVRIPGIDTPEMSDPRPEVRELAEKARKMLASKLLTAKKIELRRMRRDKYFRILADVDADGVDMSAYMLENAPARPYGGGTKDGW